MEKERDDKGCYQEMTSPNVIRKGQEVKQTDKNCIIIEGLTLKKEMGTVLSGMGCLKFSLARLPT